MRHSQCRFVLSISFEPQSAVSQRILCGQQLPASIRPTARCDPALQYMYRKHDVLYARNFLTVHDTGVFTHNILRWGTRLTTAFPSSFAALPWRTVVSSLKASTWRCASASSLFTSLKIQRDGEFFSITQYAQQRRMIRSPKKFDHMRRRLSIDLFCLG